MATMYYPDEVRATTELDLPDDDVLISDQEMAMAATLIDQLTGPYEPEQYHDEYRSALERVIEAKLGAAEPVTVAPTPAKGKVVDLMEALKASIQATKKETRRTRSVTASTAASTSTRKRKATARKVG